MAIKQLLELIGDDIVIAKLKNVQKAGEDTLSSFNKSGGLKLDVDTKPIEDFTGQTIKLKDILHTVAPALKTAGASIGELGAFARLAGGNVALLAAALGGAIIVALAKMREEVARTKGQLDDAFGGRGPGRASLRGAH